LSYQHQTAVAGYVLTLRSKDHAVIKCAAGVGMQVDMTAARFPVEVGQHMQRLLTQLASLPVLQLMRMLLASLQLLRQTP